MKVCKSFKKYILKTIRYHSKVKNNHYKLYDQTFYSDQRWCSRKYSKNLRLKVLKLKNTQTFNKIIF